MAEKNSSSSQKFLVFDWGASEEWQLYLSNLYPTPPASKILHWKKKWYKANIDSDFDMNTDVVTEEIPTASTSSTTSPSAKCPPASATSTRTVHIANGLTPAQLLTARRAASILRLLAATVSILYILPFCSKRVFSYAVWLHVIANMAAIVAKFGFPKFSMDWAQPVLIDDSTLALFFSMTALALGGNMLALLSPSITAVLGIAEMYTECIAPIIPSAIERKLNIGDLKNSINDNRYQIMQFRANVEVMLGLITFALIFVGKANPISVLLYMNALRSAYQFNSFTQLTFSNINNTVSRVLSHQSLPPMIYTTYVKVANGIHSYVSGGQQSN